MKIWHPDSLTDNHVSVCSLKMGAATCTALSVLIITTIVSSSTILESSVVIKEFGENIIINCTQKNYSLIHSDPAGLVLYWVLPANMTIVHRSTTVINSNMELLDNGWSLKISNVEEEDLGSYLCLTASSSRNEYYIYSRVRVAIYDFPPVNFRRNLITGAIAAGAIFLVIVCVCIIYSCRWRPPPGQSKSVHMRQNLYDIEYSYGPESPTVEDVM